MGNACLILGAGVAMAEDGVASTIVIIIVSGATAVTRSQPSALSAVAHARAAHAEPMHPPAPRVCQLCHRKRIDLLRCRHSR